MGFKVVRAQNQTELWYKVVRWHLYQEEVDLKLGIGTNLNNVILETPCMDFNFNLREVWLHSSRWTMLTREYLDGPETSDFIRRSRIILTDKGSHGVITNVHFRGVTRRDKRHKWGNCLLAATFRGSTKGTVVPTLTLHSRVSYNAYMLGMDMALAHTLARYIGNPTQIRLQWHLDVMQLHSFKCLPYLYTQPDLMKVLEKEIDRPEFRAKYPTWDSVGRWWDMVRRFEREGKTLEEEKYGPLRRIRRRYEEYKRGILVPSVPVKQLTFEKVEGFDADLP